MTDVPEAEYDGWRLGTRGRGGCGARGNRVNCLDETVTGPVGDFSEAAVSGDMEFVLEIEDFLVALRCLNSSSLCNLIRINLFAGAISSPPEDAFDFERVWRDGLSTGPSRVGGRSVSESDVMAVDVDATDSERRELLLS